MFDLLSTIGQNDIAYGWISELFGDDPTRPLSAAFAVFTSSLVFLGSLLMGWHILVGIVNSAYTGKVLGQNWHQIWAPLRVVLGFGMLVPIGGGFSAVHSLLENVIGVAAVNLGNQPILAYIKGATARENAAKVKTTYGTNLANQFLKKEVCFHVVDQMNKQTIGRYVGLGVPVYQPTKSQPDTILGIGQSARLWSYGACGEIGFHHVEGKGSEAFTGNDEALERFNLTREEATTELMNSVRQAGFFKYEQIALLLATNGGWDTDTGSVKDFVKLLVSKNYLDVNGVSELEAIGAKWNEKVSAAASDVFKQALEANADPNKENSIVKRIEKFGFMVAGSYERTLSSISGMALTLTSTNANVIPPDLNESYSENVAKANDILRTFYDETPLRSLALGVAEPKSDEDWVPWVLGKVFGDNLSNAYIGQTSSDPVGDMMAFGHSLLNTASLAVLGLVAAGFLVGVPSAATQSGMMAFNVISSWIGWIIMTFIVVGFLYSFVLPMMPMIMVLIMGISWLILFLEAAIAGVLWAFAFIRMDGQEFFDKNQAPGITLLFNLLMRPALGMLAYCGMLLLQPLLLNSLALVWGETFAVQTGGSLGGLVWFWQYAASLILYCYLQWHITLRLTGLIPSIPDRVGHWMGMQMHGYNDGGETSSAIGAFVGAGMATRGAPFVPNPGPPKGMVGNKTAQNGKDGEAGASGDGSGRGSSGDTGGRSNISPPTFSTGQASMSSPNTGQGPAGKDGDKGDRGDKGEYGHDGRNGRDGRDGQE